MLFWLLNTFAPLLEQLELHSSGDSRVFLTARTALASVTSFVTAILFGPLAIRWLRSRFRERIASDSARLNELHAGKSHTPTMGGLFVGAAMLVAVLLWGDLSNGFVRIGLCVVLGYGAIGAADDWIKLRSQRKGLTIREKFGLQLALALAVGTLLYLEVRDQPHGLTFALPFGPRFVWLSGGFVAWSALVLVGSSNGVNLTDGLDGLASGCLVFAGSAFVALTYLAGHRVMADYLAIPYVPGSGELSILFGAMVGAMLGFLWFNCYPAQVFMGDTGSLPTGALLGLGALVTHQELLLVLVGGIFVIETLSVILQVAWFRFSGRRLIACSPLHNHFLFKGDHEIKIVVRFWIGAALLAIISVASLKIG